MLTIINAVASAVIALSVTGFLAMVLAHDVVDAMPVVLRLWIKASLALIAAGSLLNVLMLSTPMWSEVVLNCGLAGLFSWAFYWHRQRWQGVSK